MPVSHSKKNEKGQRRKVAVNLWSTKAQQQADDEITTAGGGMRIVSDDTAEAELTHSSVKLGGFSAAQCVGCCDRSLESSLLLWQCSCPVIVSLLTVTNYKTKDPCWHDEQSFSSLNKMNRQCLVYCSLALPEAIINVESNAAAPVLLFRTRFQWIKHATVSSQKWWTV